MEDSTSFDMWCAGYLVGNQAQNEEARVNRGMASPPSQPEISGIEDSQQPGISMNLGNANADSMDMAGGLNLQNIQAELAILDAENGFVQLNTSHNNSYIGNQQEVADIFAFQQLQPTTSNYMAQAHYGFGTGIQPSLIQVPSYGVLADYISPVLQCTDQQMAPLDLTVSNRTSSGIPDYHHQLACQQNPFGYLSENDLLPVYSRSFDGESWVKRTERPIGYPRK